MRKWKQISACCLAAVLAVGAPAGTAYAGSPEFARTAEEWARLRDNVMEYDELAGLIHEYNVTVQNNQRDYNEKKNKTSEDMAQDYRDAADALRSSLTGGDDPMSLINDLNTESSARNLEEQADKNVDDSEILKMGYDQTEATLVSSAQANMVAYHQKVLELELKKKQKELLDATYNSVLVKQSAGMATQMDVLTAQENMLNGEVAILAAQADLDNTKQKLCVMLGWKFDASPEIREIPAADMARISAMNPAVDLAAALENNYTLRMNRKKYDNATGTNIKDNLQDTIKNNEQKIGNSLNGAYQGVLEAKNTYDQAAAAFAVESKNMEAADRKMQIGAISRLEYLNQQYTYQEKETNLKIADMKLFQAMETYDWTVKGLADT